MGFLGAFAALNVRELALRFIALGAYELEPALETEPVPLAVSSFVLRCAKDARSWDRQFCPLCAAQLHAVSEAARYELESESEWSALFCRRFMWRSVTRENDRCAKQLLPNQSRMMK